MIPLIEELSIAEMEFDVPCGVKGCSHDADWMGRGDHSIFGCPGYGPVCEFHRRVTLHFLEGVDGETTTCKCGNPRTFSPAEFRFIAL